MKFEKTQTSYAVYIDKDDFLSLMDSESYVTEDAAYKPGNKSLHEKLNEFPGVNNVEYDGHFGNYIFLSIDADEDDTCLHEDIYETIMAHIEWCKTLDVVDWVKEKREKEK